MADAGVIFQTLERAGDLCGDPSDKVYARLFGLHPEFEPLFFMDTDGGVRGAMLETAIECILGVAEGDSSAEIQVSSARFQHEGYGVPERTFDALFVAMRDVFREVLGAEWTETHEREWKASLDELAAIG